MSNIGIEYFTDLNCLPRFRKYHTKGIKNIWRVVITDHGYSGKEFTWVMPYDTFHLAAMRFKAELSYYSTIGKCFDTMIDDRVYVQCATYNDTELVGIERLNGEDLIKGWGM